MKYAFATSCAALALAAAAGFGSALVLGNGSRAERAPAATILPVTFAAAEAAGPLGQDPARVCVQAFSKDLCDSVLERGDLVEGGCDEMGCRIAYVSRAPFYLNMIHNGQGCSADGRCDEVAEKDGWLESSITYTLRLEDPCRLRGYFDGRWLHHANDGTVYQGSVTGTLGVGTHREFQCQSNTERQCERCLDVEFLEDQGLWRIGVEASYVGREINGTADLRFTLSGDFYAKGDANGPYDLDGGWRFQGTADGAHVLYCH